MLGYTVQRHHQKIPTTIRKYGTGGTTYLLNPIGGGANYSDIYTTGDYVVTNLADFKSYMVGGAHPAASGKVVFVPSGTTLDFTGSNPVTIPAGVTVASDRGYNGNTGAVLKKSSYSGTIGLE